MTLEKTFQSFLLRHYQGGKPLLLCLSGGPDSLALFYLLLKYKIPFGVAHVDHGWRPESGSEAALLRELAQKHQVLFHEKKLQAPASELICRQERLKFFASLYPNYQALVLGHQRDDQVETVLKRVLEGASLPNLAGMQEVSLLNNMIIWRPLLTVPKNEILDWTEDLHPFHDSTNCDPKYLRGRMREQIIPQLKVSFGKEIENSFIHLAEEASLLQDFLKKHLEPYLQSKTELSAGNLTPFELKALIRLFCKDLGFTPSRDFVSKAAHFLGSRALDKTLIAGKYRFYVHKGKMVLTHS